MGPEKELADVLAKNEQNLRTIYDAMGVYLGEYEGVLEPAELDRAQVIRSACGKVLRVLAVSRKKVSPNHQP